MTSSRFSIILGLLFLGVLSRLLPHPPNFTAMNAIAFFSAYYLHNPWLTLFTTLSAMFLSDFALGGFHSTLPFVYLSLVLIVFIGHYVKQTGSLRSTVIRSIGISLLFFMISNFGSWAVDGIYPLTLNGLSICYFIALPFLATQVLGDIVFGVMVSSILLIYESKKSHINQLGLS